MTPNERIRVMVADDHPIMRNGLRDALDAEEDFEVVGQAADGDEAVGMAERVEPDVIVMDVMMPGKDGVDACREIIETLPGTQVLMLTASSTEDAVIEAVAAGATGYLQKHSGPEELAVAIRDVAAGRLRIPERSIRQVFALVRGQRGLASGRVVEEVTNREKEILRLFALGKSYAQIAEARGNKASTIKNAIYRIQEKLGVESKQEIVVWAVRNGLLEEKEAGELTPTCSSRAEEVSTDGAKRGEVHAQPSRQMRTSTALTWML